MGEPPDRLAPFGGAKPAAPTCLGLPGCVVAALPGQIRTARTAWEGVGPLFPEGRRGLACAASRCIRKGRTTGDCDVSGMRQNQVVRRIAWLLGMIRLPDGKRRP